MVRHILHIDRRRQANSVSARSANLCATSRSSPLQFCNQSRRKMYCSCLPQCWRSAFASCALLAKPDWLFLDEATASLDVESEKAFFEALQRCLPNTTIVSIAHRPEVTTYHRTWKSANKSMRVLVRSENFSTSPRTSLRSAQILNRKKPGVGGLPKQIVRIKPNTRWRYYDAASQRGHSLEQRCQAGLWSVRQG